MRRLLLLLVFASASHAGTYAVCAGVESYDDPGISPLRYAVADAKGLAEAFRASGVPADHIRLLTSDATEPRLRPTRSNLLRVLQDAKESAGVGDAIVFAFAGHGMQKPEGSYLLPVDTDRALLSDTALPVTLVNAALKGCQAENVLFILDACRNDPDAGRAAADAALDESFARSLRPVRTSTAIGRGPRVATLLACEAGQRAWEMPAQGHGAFTWHLIQGLQGQAADEKGSVTLSRLAAYLQREVPSWAERAGREQTPRLDNPDGVEMVLSKAAVTQTVVTTATLTVTSFPAGAKVFVDGADTGQTTNCDVVIDLGVRREREVEIGLELPGHKPAVGRLLVTRGTRLPLVLRLERGAAVARPLSWPAYLASYQPPAPMTWGSYRVSSKDAMPQVFIPAGEFVIGSPAEEVGHSKDEGPQKGVYISGFWMDVHEVTVGQFKRFCAQTRRPLPDGQRSEAHPVVRVSWDEATAYAQWAGRQLPTEAQWEKAARGGTTTAYPWGEVWDAARANGGQEGSKPVGGYPTNGYGLLDMIGNVWEWCRDSFVGSFYATMPARDPVNTAPGEMRATRGGSWGAEPSLLRPAYRAWNYPANRTDYCGFRCVAAP